MVANATGGKYTPEFSGVYYDKGGAEIWMDTFSVPVIGPDGELAGVATADIRQLPPSAEDSGAGSGAMAPSPSPGPAEAPKSGSVPCWSSAWHWLLMASLVLLIVPQ
jgi:hypothetical protein